MIGKWIVQIPAGLFMSGIHRFKTKKLAQEFVDKWNRTPGNAGEYKDLPVVQREER
jgi:hypothetical protein